jgi:hypothetical protein
VREKSQIANKRTIELEAIRSFKKKMKQKQDKAIAELQDFFNKCSDSDSNSNDSNEFMDIVEPRRIEVFAKDGKRKKRFHELESLSHNLSNKKRT